MDGRTYAAIFREEDPSERNANYPEDVVSSEEFAVHLMEATSQTSWTRSSGQSPPRDASTQVQTTGLFLSREHDKVIQASHCYIDSQSLNRKREYIVIVIQRWIRGLIARRQVRMIRRARAESARNREIENLSAEDAVARKVRFEARRREKPLTAFDVDLLRREVDEWAERELEQIRQRSNEVSWSNSREARKVLAKAVQMRNAIHIHREPKLTYTPKILHLNGSLVEVVDEKKEALTLIFNRLKIEPPRSISDRLCVLRELKDLIFEDEDFFEVSDLVSREEELLTVLKQPFSAMPGLRLRMRQALYRLLTTV